MIASVSVLVVEIGGLLALGVWSSLVSRLVFSSAGGRISSGFIGMFVPST